MAFRPFTPADGPAWLPRFAESVADLFRRILPAPLRLRNYATAELPPPADHAQGLAYDSTISGLTYSNGSAWVRLADHDGGLAAIAALGTTGLLCRTGADAWALRAIAGTANEVTVANGGGVLGAPTLSLPAALTFTGKTVTGGTFAAIALSGTTQLSGGQLAFPATQSPSADPNTLDDYEEGSFTPVLRFGGASTGIAYSLQAGRYTKIGRLLFVEVAIVLTNKGSATGTAIVAGLPFTVAAAPHPTTSILAANLTSVPMPLASPAAGTTTINLYNYSGTTYAQLTNTNFGNSSQLLFSFAYTV